MNYKKMSKENLKKLLLQLKLDKEFSKNVCEKLKDDYNAVLKNYKRITKQFINVKKVLKSKE